MTSEEFRTNPLFLRNQFKSDGVFEIPMMQRSKIGLDDIALVGYDKLGNGSYESIVHFFLDDYKFETLWKDPETHVEKLKPYKAMLSPQFSLYIEMPLALQAFNTFRNRWCGVFFQSKGIEVIPSLVWGEPDTYWFCFDGIQKGSVVAVSTVGMRREKDLFLQGYKEMLKRIEPSGIICYGEPFPEMTGKVIYINYSETNNLIKWHKVTGQPAKAVLIPPDEIFVLKGGGRANSSGGTALPTRGKPNSKQTLFKYGERVQERYYDENGNAYRDIDYSNHGNPRTHAKVPHEHLWDWSNPDEPKRGGEK